jgi:CUB/sushi domain-containing protein
MLLCTPVPTPLTFHFIPCLSIIAIICPILKNPQYGSVVVTKDYRVGSKATYTCYKGYKLVGVAERTCQYSGVYSGEEPICKRKEILNCNLGGFQCKIISIAAIICPTLENPLYGFVIVTKDYRVGSKATYTCIKGYKLVGVAERTCLYSGYYSDDVPICKRKLESLAQPKECL